MNEGTSTTATQNTPTKCVTISIDREFALNHAATFTTIVNDLLNREITERDTTSEKNIREGVCYLSWIIEDILYEYMKTE